MGVGVGLILEKCLGVQHICHVSNVFFWWLNLVRLYPLYKVLYPKRRIQSYSIMGTIVPLNPKP